MVVLGGGLFFLSKVPLLGVGGGEVSRFRVESRDGLGLFSFREERPPGMLQPFSSEPGTQNSPGQFLALALR